MSDIFPCKEGFEKFFCRIFTSCRMPDHIFSIPAGQETLQRVLPWSNGNLNRNSYSPATGRPLSKVYSYRMPVPYREHKENTFLCKGKALCSNITPLKAHSNPSGHILRVFLMYLGFRQCTHCNHFQKC